MFPKYYAGELCCTDYMRLAENRLSAPLTTELSMKCWISSAYLQTTTNLVLFLFVFWIYANPNQPNFIDHQEQLKFVFLGPSLIKSLGVYSKIFWDNLISIIESRSLISIYFVVTFCEITMFVSVSIDRFSVGNCKTPSHAL